MRRCWCTPRTASRRPRRCCPMSGWRADSNPSTGTTWPRAASATGRQVQEREEQLRRIARATGCAGQTSTACGMGTVGCGAGRVGLVVWIVMQTREVSVQTSLVLTVAAEAAADAEAVRSGPAPGRAGGQGIVAVPRTRHCCACRSRERPMAVACAHCSSVTRRQVASASFSPDGKRVVTASADKTARVWDAETGKPVGEPMTHGERVYSASFSPDGKRVVTASGTRRPASGTPTPASPWASR